MIDRDPQTASPLLKGHAMGEITRRKFVTTVAGTGAALTVVPRHVLGRGVQAPSDTVNIAVVGLGMGANNAANVMSQNIVAFCDVQDSLMASAIQRYEKAAAATGATTQRGGGTARRQKVSAAQEKANARRAAQDNRANAKRFVSQNLPKLGKYRDYRQMLEKQKDIDAVIIATPDHMHAPIAAMAMDMGKHVYVQKPLCWSVEEARYLAKKARERKVVTQMGNQGHSLDDARTGVEYVQSGAIGEISEVHVWTNRPLGYWPQGVPRPAPLDPSRPVRWSGRDVDQRLAAAIASGSTPKPGDLDWDLFLGCAPLVEYHPIYHPFNWRGWVDWGQGALGDMGAHLIDHPFWALDLGLPTTVETLSTPFNGASFPSATTTYYEFPKRGNLPAVKLTWYDGGLLPPKPEDLGDVRMNPGGGLMYVGSKGKLVQDTYGAQPQLFPAGHPASQTPPPEKLARIAHEEHEMNWVEAIKGQAEISSPFDYATKLTEVMLLGVVALRAGTKIHYDGENMKVTNSVATSDQPLEGDQLLRREYRQGFGLPDTKTL
jgi:predicted dehydrogenase